MRRLLDVLLATRPAVLWPLDDVKSPGSARDVSGNGRNGSQAGDELPASSFNLLPAETKAPVWDGTNRYIRRLHDSALDVGTGDFTHMAFCRATWTSGVIHEVFCRDHTATGNGQLCRTNSSHQLYSNTGGTVVGPFGPAINDSRSHHVAYLRRSGTVELWLDGHLLGSATAAGSTNLSAELRLGQADGSQATFVGPIGWYGYWTRALAPADIRTVHQIGLRHQHPITGRLR